MSVKHQLVKIIWIFFCWICW